ncbi:MAG: 6-bladed beta-propeller [Thermoanaerobaculales bacterium]
MNFRRALVFGLATVFAMSSLVQPIEAKKKKKKDHAEDPYAAFVWPPPPDEPRIRLVDIIDERSDVEAESKLKKILIGAGPQNPYDHLRKPYGVAYDSQGRLLLTDTQLNALFRFDLADRRLDVFGTTGASRLAIPLGVEATPDGLILVASSGNREVVAFDDKGSVVAVYGRDNDLKNPTDMVLHPNGSTLYVADSKAHEIVVFDVKSRKKVFAFGRRGEGDGEFNYPTALAFGPEGNLFVVDQLNSRVQLFSEEGEYLDQFGNLGTGFGSFVRPKDIAVDEHGLIYVTDAAFGNVQIFDIDFQLLTFIGTGGRGPGEFQIAAGIAVHGDDFAVIDQLNHRVQLFRFIAARDGE